MQMYNINYLKSKTIYFSLIKHFIFRVQQNPFYNMILFIVWDVIF